MAKAYAEHVSTMAKASCWTRSWRRSPRSITPAEIDHTRYGSLEQLTEHCLAHLRDAVALLDSKATPQELDDYKSFIVNLADKVARAHRESGRGEDPVSDTEQAAIATIVEALG